MSHFIGLDIGGTKIAGGLFASDGVLVAEKVVPTAHDYSLFLTACVELVTHLRKSAGHAVPLGIGIAGRIARDGEVGDASPNMVFLQGKSLRNDLSEKLGCDVRLANDANCMALAEAVDGAGVGYDNVVGITLGTGIGGAFVFHQRIVVGTNGLAGEFGHLPLPFRDDTDGPIVPCGCRQQGCIEKSICGGALARLYAFMTGKEADAKTVSELAHANDTDALRVLDRYYETFAKAMVAVIHTFDPDVIVLSGSLISLPKLFDEVPKRWGKYTYMPTLETRFVPAKHGSLSGMRGAAWLWR